MQLATREAPASMQTTTHMVSLSHELTPDNMPRRNAVSQKEQSNPPARPAMTGFADSPKMSL